jgi:hypothetical protein
MQLVEVNIAHSFQSFLLNSPEMSDEELQYIQEKRKHLNNNGKDIVDAEINMVEVYSNRLIKLATL